MKIKDLIQNVPDALVMGSREISISGISANSKTVMPGNLFIAKKGFQHDGKDYLKEAVARGASAIAVDSFDPSFRDVVQIVHRDIVSIMGDLVACYTEHPSRKLFMVGVTGTNGKTTTSFIIKQLLDELSGLCGLIGGVECIIGKERRVSTLTTPDVISNHMMLREMVDRECLFAAMEVSSHALDQGRVDQIDFDVAVFSNLTLEHLDYHKTMEEYARAKRRLFESLTQDKWAIVNQDSPWSHYMLQGCVANVLTYGLDKTADLFASDIRLHQHTTHLTVTYQGKSIPFVLPFIGRFNVSNCLAAIAVALIQNISLEMIADILVKIPPVLGRLQPVQNSRGIRVYVDHAHKPDALLTVLQTLKEIAGTGRLIVVFGCGGDRDRLKRPKMAEACEKYADVSIVTTDNPRTECMNQICAEIIAGFSSTAHYFIELDRKMAIQKALRLARIGDTVVIAGKGHETKQIFADRIVEFDDAKVAAYFLKEEI